MKWYGSGEPGLFWRARSTIWLGRQRSTGCGRDKSPVPDPFVHPCVRAREGIRNWPPQRVLGQSWGVFFAFPTQEPAWSRDCCLVFVAVQFPIADSRLFVPNGAGRVMRPGWPTPKADREFVRSFGVVRARPIGPSASWSENSFCDADRVIRFPPGFGRVPVNRDGRHTTLIAVYRRLFTDGAAIVRLECGLATRSRRPVIEDLDEDALMHLIGVCLAVSVTVQRPKSPYEGDLVHAGNAVAIAYRRATGRVGADTAEAWMVTAESPSMVVQYAGDPTGTTPRFARRLESLSGDDIACMQARVRRGQDVYVYVLVHLDKADPDKLRRLRHFLLRRHAEREVIKAVLALLRDGRIKYEPGGDESEQLSRWIDDTLKALAAREAYGFVLGMNDRLALGFDDVISHGETDLLIERLEATRRSIKARLRALNPAPAGSAQVSLTIGTAGNVLLGNQIGGLQMESNQTKVGNISNSNIGGIGSKFSVADSLNTIAQSPANDELKSLLRDLAKQVEALTTQAPGDQAEAASRDADDFIREATSAEPRKGVLEAFGNGLKSTAQAVGQVGLPIVTLVAKIMGLF